MASTTSATPDTPITLKVNFDGVTRRFKLPLRDLGATVFEDKLRSSLQIPVGTPTTVERYSDSAATYVVLDPSNTSVYKQLYRAAKAKQKLKLRVTSQTEPEAEKSSGPKPATVEDEPEAESETSFAVKIETSANESPRSPAPAATPVPPPKVPLETSAPAGTMNTILAPQHPDEFPAFIKEWRSRGMPRIHLRKDAAGVEVIDFVGPASAADPMVTSEPLAEASLFENSPFSRPQYQFSQTASKLSFADLIREARDHEAAASSRKEEKKPVLPPVVEKNEPATVPICGRRPFTVCCNSCDLPVPDAHFHCSTCDDGDFDLCQNCVDQGITCYDENHWMIKRTIRDGMIAYSTTHIAPKSTRARSKLFSPVAPPSIPEIPFMRMSSTESHFTTYSARTCNCCVQEFPEKEFLHCTTCEDYDLCKTCFTKERHGHHPQHGFTPAVPGTSFDRSVTSRLAPGRDVIHNAICDGCDNYIRGVRNKCLDCPDWDYCQDCVQNANFIHPNHRFVTIFEPIVDRSFRSLSRYTHVGICCDGPLCSSARSGSKYITGVRYKCAVCHDTDFCANCEASPANTHNKTHPMIKFRTPVRHVSVTTTGEHEDGQRMPAMGDRVRSCRVASRSTETTPSSRQSIALNTVQTVVDVKPTEPQQAEVSTESTEVKKEIDAEQATLVEEKTPVAEDLVAIYQRDTIADGTLMPPNHTFEQTWYLKNEGTVAWPAGCSVKFVGGDYMGAVDPTHPAGLHELVSASESTVCYSALQPGQEFPFTVLMRTPDRPGKVISYWRLTTSDGVKFGHKLWCDVNVMAPAPQIKEETTEEDSQPEVEKSVELEKSQMIIPKLEHESPSSSIHEPSKPEVEAETETETLAPSTKGVEAEDDFEDCGDEDEWAEDSDDGFMTDEEYDILDASDEEYLSEQQKMVAKK